LDERLARAKQGNDKVELAAALKAYNKAHERYMGLPDEALAWEAGQHMQVAVRQYQRLRSRVMEALEALNAKREAFENAPEADQAELRRELNQTQEAYDKVHQEYIDFMGEGSR
jgi:hypothetical protein